MLHGGSAAGESVDGFLGVCCVLGDIQLSVVGKLVVADAETID